MRKIVHSDSDIINCTSNYIFSIKKYIKFIERRIGDFKALARAIAKLSYRQIFQESFQQYEQNYFSKKYIL